MTIPTSAYEAWVTALRAWRDDPRHDMSNLPVLVVDSLPPTAYDRLLSHIIGAQQHVMARWSEVFARDWGAARDEQARVRALLDTRLLLARRLQLAGHHGLPEVVRTELTNGVVRDVRQLQDELEEAVTRQQPGTRIDRVQTERALHMMRANRLTVILEPGFSLQALLEGQVAAVSQALATAPLAPHESSVPNPPVRRRRAIIVDN